MNTHPITNTIFQKQQAGALDGFTIVRRNSNVVDFGVMVFANSTFKKKRIKCLLMSHKLPKEHLRRRRVILFCEIYKNYLCKCSAVSRILLLILGGGLGFGRGLSFGRDSNLPPFPPWIRHCVDVSSYLHIRIIKIEIKLNFY